MEPVAVEYLVIKHEGQMKNDYFKRKQILVLFESAILIGAKKSHPKQSNDVATRLFSKAKQAIALKFDNMTIDLYDSEKGETLETFIHINGFRHRHHLGSSEGYR